MKISLVRKMVIGLTLVSLITYGTSALFIFVLKPWIAPSMADWLYVSATLLLGVFWTGFLGWVAAKWLVRPIIALSHAAKEAASGNLQVEIKPYRSRDELQVLNESFIQMIESLKGMIHNISDSAGITAESAGTLSLAITKAIEHIESISENVDGIYHGVKEQESSVGSTMTTSKRMHEAALAMKTDAERMQSLSVEIGQTMKESGEVISSLVHGMKTLSDSNSGTLETVRLLENDASEIESITATVRQISEQTRLLALNASIEAARAGEYGQGFSVVASEIRKLSEQSESSVLQINQIVERLQSQIKNTVSTMHTQAELVVRGSSQRDNVQAAISNMAASVKDSITAMQRMERTIAAQSEEIEQTYQQMSGIADMAQHITEGAKQIAVSTSEETAIMEEISSSSEMLRDQTDRLKNSIKIFRF